MSIFSFLIRTLLFLFLGILGLSLLAQFIIGLYFGLVPVHSVTTEIADLRTTVKLELHGSGEIFNEFGSRYLTVATANDSLTIRLTDEDWVFNSRISLYQSHDGRLAILVAAGEDHIVSLAPLRDGQALNVPSDDWVYLGAFDFLRSREHALNLKFFLAGEQPECIPMHDDVVRREGYPRNEFRRRDCPRYWATER